jgi:hypothetical protein
MQVMFRSLLTAAFVTWIASCSLNDHGLGSADAGRASTGGAGHPQGAAGVAGMVATGAAGAAGTMTATTGTAGTDATPTAGTTGNPGAAGAGGDSSTGGAAGDSSTGGAAGDSSTGGTAGDSSTGGAAGDSSTGDAAGTPNPAGGAGGTPSAGAGGTPTGGTAGTSNGGVGGTSNGGASGAGAAGSTAHPPEIGCSDGTREGYLDRNMYPNIAACAGGWAEPGLASNASRTPECDRRAGNDGDKADGRGCSVTDLCASGWHVCETAHAVSVATGTRGCADAIAPSGDKLVFFVTRQRANGLACDATNQTGANNLYGCGTIGSTADKASCAPFTRMLRDSDCQSQFPWVCSDGPNGTSTDEYTVVTKQGSSRGGALCCKD